MGRRQNLATHSKKANLIAIVLTRYNIINKYNLNISLASYNYLSI